MLAFTFVYSLFLRIVICATIGDSTVFLPQETLVALLRFRTFIILNQPSVSISMQYLYFLQSLVLL